MQSPSENLTNHGIGIAREIRRSKSDPNDLSKRKWRSRMGWSDEITNAVGNMVGQAEGQALPDFARGVLGVRGVDTILAKLRDAGFADQVSSWLDRNRDNLPITADQLRNVLSDQHLQQVASSLGIPIEAVLAALSKSLPAAASAGPRPMPSAGDGATAQA
jgi:uncharacterized protein YidB (DUF937 family)